MKTYPYLNILMFPTTDCNLRCKYCFHAEGSYENIKITTPEDLLLAERIMAKRNK